MAYRISIKEHLKEIRDIVAQLTNMGIKMPNKGLVDRILITLLLS